MFFYQTEADLLLLCLRFHSGCDTLRHQWKKKSVKMSFTNSSPFCVSCRRPLSRERSEFGLRLHPAQLPSQRLHLQQQHQHGAARTDTERLRRQHITRCRRVVDSQRSAQRRHHQPKGERRLRLRHHQFTQPT